jgi:hypothetical protein
MREKRILVEGTVRKEAAISCNVSITITAQSIEPKTTKQNCNQFN